MGGFDRKQGQKIGKGKIFYVGRSAGMLPGQHDSLSHRVGLRIHIRSKSAVVLYGVCLSVAAKYLLDIYSTGRVLRALQ